MKLTEKQFAELESKMKLNIPSRSNKKVEGIKFDKSIEKPKKKNTLRNVTALNKNIENSTYEITYSEGHFAILFKGAQLLSVNQIFTALEFRPYDIYNYKKAWHKKIMKVLFELKLQKHNLPFFDSNVEVMVYRSAQNLVDRDALHTMFKYILDAFKYNLDTNPYGLIPDDNPNIVVGFSMASEKGEDYVGIKLKRIEPPIAIDGKNLLLHEATDKIVTVLKS